MTQEDLNKKPEGLSAQGDQAYEAIMKLLAVYSATNTGGCKSFYSPAEWSARGERYGCNSVLIVAYDGGDLAPFFSLDHGHPTYKLHTKMAEALEAAGFYVEECTGWYSAVYPEPQKAINPEDVFEKPAIEELLES